jgi:hypothetical protein
MKSVIDMFSRKTLSINVVAFLLLWIFPAGAMSAELTSSVDRNSISINETLTLTMRYDDRAGGDALDVEALRQDFDVLSVRPQTSNSVSIVNGSYNQQTQTTWTITLAPRREGTLIIPSFNVDGNVSDAIAIEVSQSSAGVTQETPMLVTLETDISQAYVGQQILITLELMAQDNVSNLSGGQLSIPNAYLELLDQQSFRRVENGIAWQVIQWEYALIPEQSGILEVPPQLFSGIISATSNYGFPDPFNQRGRRISARSNSEPIEVLPPPETNGIAWFPAKNVQINSSWSGDTSQMRVGEPLTRNIEIIATGQRASAIPPMNQPDSLTFKSYADQPGLQDRASAYGIIGTRSESTAIVPSAAGELQLPEQRIAWWNTNSETWEETILPAQTLRVLPAQQDSSFAPPDPETIIQSGTDSEATGSSSSGIAVSEGSSWYWPLITLVLALIVILQSCLLLTRSNRLPKIVNDPANPNEAQCWKMVKRSIKSKNAPGLRKAIIRWGQAYFPESGITTLDSLAMHSNDPGLKELLAKLDAALYAGNDESGPDQLDAQLGDDLGKALEALKKRSASAPGSESKLKPLYPN